MAKMTNVDLVARIFSLLFAIVLWAYVVYGENPDTEVWFRNIPISAVNEKVLSDRNLAVMNEPAKTVDVKIKGKRTIVAAIKHANISATVDYGTLSGPGSAQLPISVTLPVDAAVITDKRPYNIDLELDRVVSEKKAVELSYSGSLAQNCFLGTPTLEPEAAVVSGPESVLKYAKLVTEPISLKDVESDISATVSLKLTDESGEDISRTNIAIKPGTAEVNIPVMMRKVISVTPIVRGAPASGIRLTAQPQSQQVTVVGKASVLRDITFAFTQTIDLTEFTGPAEIRVKVILPDGVKIEDSDGYVTVRLAEEPQ